MYYGGLFEDLENEIEEQKCRHYRQGTQWLRDSHILYRQSL